MPAKKTGFRNELNQLIFKTIYLLEKRKTI